MRRAGRFAIVLLGLSGFALVAAPSPPKKLLIHLPAGITEEGASVAYFAAADDGIEAVNLATGKVLWRTHEAQRPLLLDGKYLLAQAGVKRNRLRILRFDRVSGECDLESDPVIFPAWVVTGEAHGHSFSTHWHLGKHQLILDWEASAWPVRSSLSSLKATMDKVKEQEQDDATAHKHASGVVVIDLRTGQIEARPAEKKTAPPPPPQLPVQLENLSLRWRGRGSQFGKILVLEESDEQQRFVLHSWDAQTQKEGETKELLCGKRLTVRATLDEQFLCLRDAGLRLGEDGSLKQNLEPTWWQLFSVDSGKKIGRVRDEAGMHAFVVFGKHFFYLVPGHMNGPLDQPTLQPRTLQATDLSSGKKLWQRPVAGKLLTPPPM